MAVYNINLKNELLWDNMKAFLELLEVSDILMGAQGCPWDREQTFRTLQPHILEELYEVFDAIDEKNFENLQEELGDLFYGILFLIKIAEKESLFNLETVLAKIKNKLVRRHPHVFAGEDLKTTKEIEHRWNEIKKNEPEQKKRKTIFEGIPKHLPSLAKAQKIFHKLGESTEKRLSSEEEFVKEIFELIKAAEQSNIDAESALRRGIINLEKKTTGEGLKT